jgi:hypothetical protein
MQGAPGKAAAGLVSRKASVLLPTWHPVQSVGGQYPCVTWWTVERQKAPNFDLNLF